MLLLHLRSMGVVLPLERFEVPVHLLVVDVVGTTWRVGILRLLNLVNLVSRDSCEEPRPVFVSFRCLRRLHSLESALPW